MNSRGKYKLEEILYSPILDETRISFRRPSLKIPYRLENKQHFIEKR